MPRHSDKSQVTSELQKAPQKPVSRIRALENELVKEKQLNNYLRQTLEKFQKENQTLFDDLRDFRAENDSLKRRLQHLTRTEQRQTTVANRAQF